MADERQPAVFIYTAVAAFDRFAAEAGRQVTRDDTLRSASENLYSASGDVALATTLKKCAP